MFFLYTDETNLDPKATTFFVYAGIAIKDSDAVALSKSIEEIRQRYAFPPEALLKFNSSELPPEITPEVHTNIKREVILACNRHNATLFSNIALHALAKETIKAREYGINIISYCFQCFLSHKKDFGMVLIDQFQSSGLKQYLTEKCCIGLKNLPYSQELKLDRIIGFHLSVIGSSHLCSAIDIVLGSLRFAINQYDNPKNSKLAHTLLDQLKPLFACSISDATKVSDHGIYYTPRTIKITRYHDQYCALHKFFEQYGIAPPNPPQLENPFA